LVRWQTEPETVDQSLDPSGPEAMLSLGVERLTEDSRVLDVGCRDAAHLIELVQATGASGVGLDPVGCFVEQARTAVSEAGVDDRLEIVEGAMPSIPFRDASFDLVWCRDVITVVDDLDSGIAEIARVLRPGGHLIVYTVLGTDRLEPKEAEMLFGQSLAIVPDNVLGESIEGAFRDAGLAGVKKDEIGTEWREHAEEQSQPASQALLRLARLRRQRDRIVAEAGEDIYAHVESNLHWLVYQFLGKLMPTVYVLVKPV
jgi:SAM-dependent methyltransferase